MKRIKGYLLKQRVTTLFRYFFRRRRSPARYRRLNPAPFFSSKPISKLCSWGKLLKTKAKAICAKTSGHGYYIPMGQNPFFKKSDPVPKGHLSVYVGQEDGDFKRFLVPVIYFNHPLFGQLLRDAEEKFGFTHPGGITIPCPISEFENVKTRIAAGDGRRKMLTWRCRV